MQNTYELKSLDRLEEKYYLALSLRKIFITFPNWFLISLRKDI